MPRTVRLSTPTGVTLVADEWRGDGPVVVLAHGGGQTRHSWGRTAVELNGHGYRVLAFDQRGHGDSDWAQDGSYRFSDVAADYPGVLAHAGEPVVWVGASMGGMCGLLAAADRPDAFRAMVLVDITPYPAQAGVDRILSFMAETSKHGFADLEEAADAVAGYQPDRRRPANPDGLKKNLRLGEDGRWRWHWDPAFLQVRDQSAGSRERMVDAASNLDIPVLLVRGGKSDLVTADEVRAFLEIVPAAEYVDVEDAAHMVAGDVNDVFTTAVVDFVARAAG